MIPWLKSFYPSREMLEARMFLIPLLPFIGFLLNGLFGKRYFSKKMSGAIGTLAALGAFAWALMCVLANHDGGGGREALHSAYGEWLATPNFSVSFGLYIDKLSSVMILIVTGIGTLIHLYSMGYMSHDPGYSRFFAYLNLFLFSMILLVLGDSLLTMFVGWEGVGLCSYLLIGFWYEEGKNAAAGMKAFIVNRIGDLGFLMGIFTLLAIFGTVNYVSPPVAEKGKNVTPMPILDVATGAVTLPPQPGLLDYTQSLRLLYSREGKEGHEGRTELPGVGVKVPAAKGNLDLSRTLIVSMDPKWKDYGLAGLITLACLCLFVGAMGKSAQIPLYVWLPDAMAGPTPVSALIHAATMVTAGIYMICRLHSLYAFSETALAVVAIVGATTALFSALIGLTQLDIKKVLAYSTVSQLGYMFLGLGAGAFSLGIFHVVTHAFFKALLFLGAGSVIHAMSGEQDMRRMGGLAGKLKWTFLTMLIGAMALSGVPFMSGWYSKDAILANTLARYQDSHNVLYLICYIMGIVAALCTAFYTFRLVFLTFFGKNRASEEVQHHIHESPWTMVLPLVVLALLSLFGGMLFNHAFEEAPLESLEIRNVAFHEHEALHHAHVPNLVLTALMAALGIGLAAWRYGRGGNVPDPEKSANPLYKASLNKFYVDEIYDAVIVFPFRVGAELLHWLADVLFIDGIVNGVAYLVAAIANVLRRVQTGVLNNYAFLVLAGAVGVMAYLFLKM